MWTIDPSNPNQSEHPDNAVCNFVSTCLNNEYVTQKELTGFLLTSLKEYERIFASYLKEQVDNHKSYREKAHEYFAAIRDDCIKKSEQKNLCSSILNFNYTTPLNRRILVWESFMPGMSMAY